MTKPKYDAATVRECIRIAHKWVKWSRGDSGKSSDGFYLNCAIQEIESRLLPPSQKGGGK